MKHQDLAGWSHGINLSRFGPCPRARNHGKPVAAALVEHPKDFVRFGKLRLFCRRRANEQVEDRLSDRLDLRSQVDHCLVGGAIHFQNQFGNTRRELILHPGSTRLIAQSAGVCQKSGFARGPDGIDLATRRAAEPADRCTARPFYHGGAARKGNQFKRMSRRLNQVLLGESRHGSYVEQAALTEPRAGVQRDLGGVYRMLD
ncbi:MAG: hypothetical protein EA403_09240 [Spirochaetaceae bacterium]|nr:MAG: hypothetical protein EA403_09240 [Spirochaetaceae bacterium]